MSYLTPANSPRASRLHKALVAGSSALTPRLVGETSVIVAEFPKCGGTWLSSMLGNYLDLPFPRQSLLPITFPAILHGHWKPTACGGNPIFLTRDPRDVAVSHLRHVMNRPTRSGGFWNRTLTKHAGPDFRALRFTELLEIWVTLNLEHSTSIHTWEGMVTRWLDSINRGRAKLATYEGLTSDTTAAMKDILSFLGAEVDDQRLNLAISRFKFDLISGRRSGVEDVASFYRLGVANAWRNLIEPERELVQRLVSPTAELLGYKRSCKD